MCLPSARETYSIPSTYSYDINLSANMEIPGKEKYYKRYPLPGNRKTDQENKPLCHLPSPRKYQEKKGRKKCSFAHDTHGLGDTMPVYTPAMPLVPEITPLYMWVCSSSFDFFFFLNRSYLLKLRLTSNSTILVWPPSAVSMAYVTLPRLSWLVLLVYSSICLLKPCLSLISIAVINITNKKPLGEERIYFISQFIVHHGGKLGMQGRDLEAGAEAETMEECCSLACSSWLAHLHFLHHPGPSAQDWYHKQ